MFPGMENSLHGDGKMPNLLIDIRDIGKFVAHIVDDERTLNKYVYAWGEALTETQIYDVMEEVSGEKLERIYVCTLNNSLKGNANSFERFPMKRLKQKQNSWPDCLQKTHRIFNSSLD